MIIPSYTVSSIYGRQSIMEIYSLPSSCIERNVNHNWLSYVT